ncbi:pentapeptide repeat-containing protein [Mycolicibacterium neoaurum]|uniref:pentapeptide repeat-containing protein n=1 Tax=Mycolicibacterium neoaurum TaxID=1795 RepID=UPI001BD0D06D|nr:pentapeptide repeat-containing protein [Mycolicibacterium neoaurum]QVI29474.1 pentapeptide repeat-containing protein [Mycolicibacterium neoaurum]
MKTRTRVFIVVALTLVLVGLAVPPLVFAVRAITPDWGRFWSTAAQPYATVLVGIGAIFAAGLAFWNGERERRQRAEHESDKAMRELKRELNDRYSQLVAQLSDAKPIVREAAAHGLVALADDWLAFGDEGQHRVCVAMLATYIRTPLEDPGPQCPDVPVRATVIRLISELAKRKGIRYYWRELNLQGVDLRFVSLSQLELKQFWFDSALLAGADLSDADFTEAVLQRANIDDCDLRATNLTSASLQLASAQRTNLRRTKFVRAALFGADFTDAYIISRWPKNERAAHRGSDFMSQAPIFTEAYLMGANLTNADLSGAHLDKTRLDWANFTNATLYRANLSGASVSGTVVQGADLTEAVLTDITPGVEVMLSNRTTQWPEGLAHHGMVWRDRDD